VGVRISRHVVTLPGGRQVHYRRAGSGPPVLLLHQSPASSRENVALLEQVAAHGATGIAPDTPGNGLSTPLRLGREPRMEDYAAAIVEFLDALGVRSAPVYGLHTGGVCALTLGLLYPERTSAVGVDGYVQLTAAEREHFVANYLPAIPLCASGAHLTWAWTRMRDQTLFFPWFDRRREARMRVDVPPSAVIHDWVMALFTAGDPYRDPYRAAFTFDTARAVATTRTPTRLVTADTDVLRAYHDRLGERSACVEAETAVDAAAATRRAMAFVLAHLNADPCPPAPPTRAVAGTPWSEILDVAGESMFLRRRDGRGRPVLVVHPVGQSSACIEAPAQRVLGARPLLTLDLPGHGETDACADAARSVHDVARVVDLALRDVVDSEFDVLGIGNGAVVATAIAALRPAHRRLALAQPVTAGEPLEDLSTRLAPLRTLGRFGEHWLHAWHGVRDAELFDPWHRPTAAHIRWDHAPDLEPASVHRKTLAFFQASRGYEPMLRAVSEYLNTHAIDRACTVHGSVDELWSAESS
jgi:pimeloyl-ACP methyl ester carboxylesterase